MFGLITAIVTGSAITAADVSSALITTGTILKLADDIFGDD